MAITDIIPWKRNGKRLPIRRDQPEFPLETLHRQIDRLFEDFWRDPFRLNPFDLDLWPARWADDFTPQVDVSETDQAYHIAAELPGMDENDIDISISHNTLTIKGEKHAESEQKGQSYYYAERSYGAFCREFPLPVEVDEDKIEATFKKGVLNITLPKRPEVIESRKRIKIKSS